MSSNPFLDYQQQFFKTWNENLNKIPGMEAYTQMFQNMPNPQDFWKNFVPASMPNPQDFWKNFIPANMPNPMDFWKNFQGNEWWKNMPNPQEYWKNFVPANMPNPMDYWKSFVPANLPDPTEYWKNFQSMMPGVENYWKDFAGMFPNVGNFSTMFPYKVPGMELYGKIFDLWKGMSDPTTFAKDFQEKYMDLMQDMFAKVMPNGDNSLMAKPMELMDTCVNFYKQTMGPWMQIDQDILTRIASGDTNAYMDFFKQFNEKYDETVGKYFNMMGLGLNRESNEEQMKAINAYFKSMFAGGELGATVMNALGGSMKDLVEAYQKGLADGKSFSTYREFYDLWYKTTEDALVKLFGTDEFAKTFDNYAEKYSNYMSAMNKVYERALSALPIPTNTDMKSLYKTVYDLRKDMRDLKRSVSGLTAAETKKEG